ncbi:MAG: radical SAM protein [Nanoarchaeota archaeon]|nr:radical SAM protein [Nanoarchaeota archaeon]
MAKETVFKFEDIKFFEEKNTVRGFFLGYYYFDLSEDDLERLGKWKVKDKALIIQGNEEFVKKKFNSMLDRKLHELKSLQGKDTIYVYEGFLPLIGCLYFGIMDRNTNVVEVRPLTGCNLNCIFCSVDLNQRQRDFVVNADYLADEFSKVAEQKFLAGVEVEAHINAQGEPLMYSKLPYLIQKISDSGYASLISIDTNGTLLTEKLVDELVKAGLTRFNISLNSLCSEMGTMIAGKEYPSEHVIKMCKYIAKKADILIAPVWMQGINDHEIEDMIKFSLELKKIRPQQEVPMIGIQNFLEYEYGKQPAKQISFEEFYKKLRPFEKKYNLKLVFDKDDFNIKKCITLKKPFRKNQKIECGIVCDGKFPGEKLAFSNDRIISLPDCDAKIGKKVKVTLTREKYNVFYGAIN